jgi:ABC-type transporter Mla MlaB component
VVRDFAALYGSPPAFDMDGVLARYRGEAERSRADGYPGLRVAVEMGDFVGRLGSLEALAQLENIVAQASGEVGIIVICQYDRRLIDAAARARITAEHSAVATDDGTVPLATLTATESPWGLQIAGDLDLSNAPAFARALRARVIVRPRVQLDLGALSFADVTALRTVFEVARELPSNSALVLTRVPAHVRNLLGLLRWHDPRVEVESQ